ncbi:MAG TPA: dihydropteroate synthase [Lentisphaeria bacterium]|nr:MAG: dihydropteroate synthase [Lentisphaerae bacterium GWF2_38_69]HBM15730.1 dihydropteroate synthase [Lentisphaeria bacterium]
MKILLKDRTIESNGRMLVMGIHNATPDSFSDGGRYSNIKDAVKHCLQMVDEGADIIDIGGESTRPGDISQISPEEEINRILPVIKGLKAARPDCLISIDTMKSEVAEKAIMAGADIINDVSGLKYSSLMAEIAAKYRAGIILMHMKGEPKSKLTTYEYGNLLEDICKELGVISERAFQEGVRKESIILDPGLGGGSFGKTKEQSLTLLAKIGRLKELGYPVIIGASRKGFIGDIIGESIPSQRVFGNLGAAAWALSRNLDIIRVHDVKATVQLIKVYDNIKKYS